MDNLKEYLYADYLASHDSIKMKDIITAYCIEPGFKFSVWLRFTRFHYLHENRISFLLCRSVLKYYSYKYGFDISYRTEIGKGLVISHFGSVVVNAKKIGDNCWLRPQIVIGNNGKNLDAPVIGNNVSFGVGAKVIGNVTVGNNVDIGANAVVTHDIPDKSVVVGIPAKILYTKE